MRSTAAKVLFLVASFAYSTVAQQAAQVSGAATTAGHQSKETASPHFLFGTLAISTKSPQARQQLEAAIERYENFQEGEAITHAQSAVTDDVNFALAYAVWSFAARSAGAAPGAIHKAQTLATSGKCTEDEKLLVKFMTGAQDSDLLPAIMAMNDLLKRHPRDKHVLYITGEWLYSQQDYTRGRELMEASLEQDPKFAPALNMLGYANVWALEPQPAKAIAYLKRYADTLPGDPNPQDSLGEVLRMTGDDSGSLAHYAQALQISPTFLMSQCGRGDTYTLMGKYSEARAEYDKALAMATDDHERFHVQFQKTLVDFWEGDAAQGRAGLAELSAKAAEAKDWVAAFEIDYGRMLLAPDAKTASQLLAVMESQLTVAPEGMLPARRNSEYARVLREEIRFAAANHDTVAAEGFLKKLEELASSTRDPRMETVYESSKGYLANAKGDYANAADELSSDLRSPLVVQQLILAEQKLNDAEGLEKARTRLKYLRAPTPEWYAVTQKNADNSQSALN
jgi:tetratricopeptide (TPR) repeat protein